MWGVTSKLQRAPRPHYTECHVVNDSTLILTPSTVLKNPISIGPEMPQQPTAGTSTSSQSGFIPRKEFIRQQKPPPSSFALLAIAGSGFIKLYSFSIHIIDAFRHLFEQHDILLACRENASQSLYEFSLDGKPWANSKSVASEKLLIDLVAIIYQCGYVYLSTLDYGREHDDRLVMAFSKPEIQDALSRSSSPLSPSPWIVVSGSPSYDKPRSKRIPFALSFTSGTTMRVIAPPLNLTPAILQAVRNSWPRGVVSEKKVGDNSFEFKLKGYKCATLIRLYCFSIMTPYAGFQQDTFPTDSLCHILALLSSLDAQSYTLISSISLTSHSRVKDLWIFMGPPVGEDSSGEDSSASSIHDSSHDELKRKVHGPDRHQIGVHTNSPTHRKFATEPDMHGQPVRPATDDPRSMEPRQPNNFRIVPISSSSSAGTSNTLRKPKPRAKLSTPVDQRASELHDGVVRAILPSTISSNVENMTGVGAGTARFSPNGFYPVSPHSGTGSSGKPVSPDLPISGHPPRRSRSINPSYPPYSPRPTTPPLFVSHLPSPPLSPRGVPNAPLEQQGGVTANTSSSAMPGSGCRTPPLLGASAFRDSAFSSSSQATNYVPIKAHDEKVERDQEDPERSRPSIGNRASSMGPILPGGWQPSPVKEEPEMDGSVNDAQSPVAESNTEGGTETPIHEVGSRVTSPELNRPDSRLRKSEAAVVGMIVNPVPPPSPLPRLGQDKRKDSLTFGIGQGWVLVNVDGMGSPSPVEMSPARDTYAVSRSPETLSPTSVTWNGPDKGDEAWLPEARPMVANSVMNESKKSKSKYKQTDSSLDGSPPGKLLSGFRRKISVSILYCHIYVFKMTAVKRVPKSSKLPTKGSAVSEDARARPGLRDKLKLFGTPEASRNDSKRRSID